MHGTAAAYSLLHPPRRGSADGALIRTTVGLWFLLCLISFFFSCLCPSFSLFSSFHDISFRRVLLQLQQSVGRLGEYEYHDDEVDMDTAVVRYSINVCCARH